MKYKKLFSYLSLALILVGVAGESSFADHLKREIVSNSEENVFGIYGQSPGEQFGASLKIGDINGDNIDDMIVGAPFSSTALNEWNGKVSVFFGGKNSTSQNPDLNFFGQHSGDQFGLTSEVGDINEDGIDDLIIGAYNAFNDDLRTGKVYIFLGRKNWEQKSSQRKNF